MSTALDVMAASQGSYVVNDTTELTKDFDAIMTLEDTVFTSLKIGGVDALADFVSTPANTVKAGAIIRTTDDTVFSGVELASGSVVIVL
jgi:predicted methyltransferase